MYIYRFIDLNNVPSNATVVARLFARSAHPSAGAVVVAVDLVGGDVWGDLEAVL